MGVVIRPAKQEDVKAIRRLIKEVLDEEVHPKNEYQWQDLQNLKSHYGGKREVFLVADNGGQIIATAAIKEDGSDVALLRRLFVHRGFRGRGYGTRLLNKAIEFCFQQGYRNVIFRGRRRMQSALKLCIQNGFERTDVSQFEKTQLVELTRDI